jgi:Protein of unknown function (DUF2800)
MASHLEMLASLRALYGGEALFRPSSISRLLGGCIGSVQRIAHSPKIERSNKFTEEGTAAHIVAEQALKGIRQPDEWTDRMVMIDDKGLKGQFVDAEMTESIMMYLDVIAERVTPTTQIYVEEYMRLSVLDPTDPVLEENRGTGDCILVDIPNGYLGVIDLKYGKGIMVPADTPQLKNYLLLALLRFGEGVQWKKLETVIVQPRAIYEHERIKPMIHDQNAIMGDFLGKLVGSMYQSLEPDQPLVPGKHCKWCRAGDANNCPALQDAGINVARDPFDNAPSFHSRSLLTAIPETMEIATIESPKQTVSSGVFLPLPASLSPDECATVLERAELVDIWVKAVKHQAAAYIDRGIKVPGWKMVQRTGNRKWNKPVPAMVDELRKIGVNMSDMFPEPSLRSPAQIEKTIPAAKRPLLKPLVDRPLGGPTLVKESDKRPAVVGFGMGAIDFDDEETAATQMGAIDT